MKRPVVAITTGVFYLDKTKWCVKHLKIGHRLNGTPFWHVSDMSSIFDSEGEAEDVAMDIATDRGLPYLFSVLHGTKITQRELAALKQYGITVE